MNRRRGRLLLLCMLLVAVYALAGCGKDSTDKQADQSKSGQQTGQSDTKEQTDTKGETAQTDTSGKEPAEELKPVVLNYYYPTITPQKDLALVEAEMNKILQKKINATIKLNAIDWGNFESKMNVMNSAGDEYDLVFTAPWMNNYFLNVAKEAYIPLDDLLDKYAPILKKTIPGKVWDAARVGGKIYGSINYQIVAMPYGLSVRRDLSEKYKLDLNQVNTFEDLDPFLEQVAMNEKGLYVSGVSFVRQTPVFGMDFINDDKSPGWYYLQGSPIKVVNQYETPEFVNFIKLLNDWQKKGYLNPNATVGLKPGQYSTLLSKPMKPGWENPDKVTLQFDGVGRQLSKPLITTGSAIATMTAISKTSKNPERAMMYLELINSDKELYNLLAHGIEGKHYVFTDKEKGVIDLPQGVAADQVGYRPGVDWMFGNQFNGYYSSLDEVGNWEKTIELNNSGEASPLLGFSFDPEPIKTELAQTKAVVDEFYDPLMTGLVDASKIDEFNKKLKDAGSDKIIAEKQRQIDEWLKTKK